MQTKNNFSSKNTSGLFRCFPTVPKDGGKPNYLVKVIGKNGIFARIFWMSHEGKFLKPANENIWIEWPKSCSPNPIEQDLPENLISCAVKIFGQISSAVKSGQRVSDFIINTLEKDLAEYESDRKEKNIPENRYYLQKMKELVEDLKIPT